MKSIFFLNGKKFCIRPLKTKEELDILEYLFSNSDENEDYNFIVNQILASQEIDLNNGINLFYGEMLWKKKSIDSNLKIKSQGYVVGDAIVLKHYQKFLMWIKKLLKI